MRILLTALRIEALLRLSAIRGTSKPASRQQQQPDHLAFLSILCHLLTHARLQALPGTVDFLFDAAMASADELADEQRAAVLARAPATATADARVAYLFGTPVGHDGWLRVVLTPPPTTAAAVAGAGVGSPSTAAATPSQASPGLRPIGGGGAPHAAAPARAMQQRVGFGAAPGGGPQSPGVRGGGSQQQQSGGASKGIGPAVPFPLKRWELLPDQGVSGGAANDTAISLALVGTRRA
jgi:mediator of RNA polymerase II transcription subunit 12